MNVSLYQLKPAFQQVLKPGMLWLAKQGITPNQVTIVSLLLCVCYGIALATVPFAIVWFFVPLVLLLRMALNAIDGMLARHTGNQTPWGGVLNEFCDILSDLAIYLPFLALPGLSRSLLLMGIILFLLSEFAGLLACIIGLPRQFDGPMGKSDRAFAFSVLAVAGWAGVSIRFLDGLLMIIISLSVLTTINRLYHSAHMASLLKH